MKITVFGHFPCFFCSKSLSNPRDSARKYKMYFIPEGEKGFLTDYSVILPIFDHFGLFLGFLNMGFLAKTLEETKGIFRKSNKSEKMGCDTKIHPSSR